MSKIGKAIETHDPLYRPMLIGLMIVTFIPFVLGIYGVDFGTVGDVIPAIGEIYDPGESAVDAHHHALRGAFVHTILEWSAFCAALFICLLSFMHYALKRDPVTPIIGTALFCAGCMDAFHTLAADRLFSGNAPNDELIPFTWAICRLFNGLITMAGIGIFFVYLRRKKRAQANEDQGDNLVGDLKLIALTCGVLGLTCGGIIVWVSSLSELPQTMYPDNMLTRPWDLAPLITYAVLALVVYPMFYRANKTLFAHSLIFSVVPDIVVQLHMAFGSTKLFDHHFNVAHFLKIFTYMVPLIGLVSDYVRAYREERYLVRELETTRDTLQRQALSLQRSNEDLTQFAYIASHDLKSPLRAIGTLTQFIEEDLDEANITLPSDVQEHFNILRGRVHRMEGLISGLLEYARVDQSQHSYESLSVLELMKEIVADGEAKPLMHVVYPQDDIQIIGNRLLLGQVLSNLVSNANKYHHRDQGVITITMEICTENAQYICIAVQDDGPGIAPEYHEKIFQIFQTLQARDSFESTGIGLSLVRKVVRIRGGKVTVASDGSSGTTFAFTWPRDERIIKKV